MMMMMLMTAQVHPPPPETEHVFIYILFIHSFLTRKREFNVSNETKFTVNLQISK